MKILILTTMYPNSQLYLSGIFVHKQVVELINQGIDINVIAPVPWSPLFISKFKKKWNKLAKVPLYEEIDGVSIYHPKYIALPKGFFKQYWSYILYFKIIRLFQKFPKLSNFDLIHVHGALPEDYTAYLLSKYCNVPYILTVHGASIYYTVKNERHFKKSKIAIEGAKKVISVSSKVAEKIINVTDRKQNIITIYNGVDSHEFNSISEENKSKGSEIIILFGASIVERKGLRFLLKSFSNLNKKFDNLKLWIAGGGERLQEMKYLSESLGISEKTDFFGTVSHKKMLSLMNSCDIFVLPSWDEAFGVVYLEAMSYKKPIIGTINEGISDLIVDGVNGLLVKPRDDNDLTEKLFKLIEDEGLRNKIGSSGYLTVKELTWKNNASKNIEVYQNILGSK